LKLTLARFYTPRGRAFAEVGVTPHVARNTNGRRSAIDGRTTRVNLANLAQFVDHNFPAN
jgi:C-terminal processing protease CtpA/Prc